MEPASGNGGGAGGAARRRLRFTVAGRLMVALSATAALSTALALALYERSLTADLQRAAEQRLERSAQAAERLLEAHLESMRERYRAISKTPQLRANLEVDHAPTLAYYARGLREAEGAAAIAFFDRVGARTAVAGRADLVAAAADVERAALVPAPDGAFAVVSTDLESAGRFVITVDPVD